MKAVLVRLSPDLAQMFMGVMVALVAIVGVGGLISSPPTVTSKFLCNASSLAFSLVKGMELREIWFVSASKLLAVPEFLGIMVNKKIVFSQL